MGTAKMPAGFTLTISRAQSQPFLSMRETQGQTFELGGPAVYSHKEILALLCAFMGVKRHLKPFAMDSSHHVEPPLAVYAEHRH